MTQDGISDVSATSDLDDDPFSERVRARGAVSSPTERADEQDTNVVRDDELLFDEDAFSHHGGVVVATGSSRNYFVADAQRAPRQQAGGDNAARARHPSRPPPIPPPFPAAEPTTAVFSRVSATPAMKPSPAAPTERRSNARQRDVTSPSAPTAHIRARPLLPDEQASLRGRYAGEQCDALDSGWATESEAGFDDMTLVGYPASADHQARVDVSARSGGMLNVEPPRTHRVHAEPQATDGLREGDVLLGRYRVIHVIEDGAVVTADVVRLGLGSTAQAFLMKSDAMGSMTAHEHFTRTARAASQLQSEHMARILDLSAARSRVGYVVFERTGATDLAELLRTRGALTVSDALDFTIQIADVLAEAHANGISHGSLRPARVFVSEGADGSPLLKVVGFGVLAQWSLLSAPTCLQAGDSLDDAVRYLAPEQIRLANLVDPRSDIWALGQLLYEMLLGVPAFAGPSSVATLAMIAADPIQSITAARPDVPRALESIVTRCLEKRPEGRYVTVAELVRALKPLVSAETQARIERIVRIGARSPRTTSTFMPPGNALVHIPTPGIFGTTESIPAVPTERVSRTTTPWRVGALLLLVMGTSGIAGVIGAVLTARSWARQATVSVPVLQQSPPAAGALALPKQVSEALQNEQIAQPSAAGQKEPATVTRTGIVESRTRSNTPAPASPIRAETPRAVKHPKVTSPVDSPADTKPAAPNRDHLFDDIK